MIIKTFQNILGCFVLLVMACASVHSASHTTELCTSIHDLALMVNRSWERAQEKPDIAMRRAEEFESNTLAYFENVEGYEGLDSDLLQRMRGVGRTYGDAIGDALDQLAIYGQLDLARTECDLSNFAGDVEVEKAYRRLDKMYENQTFTTLAHAVRRGLEVFRLRATRFEKEFQPGHAQRLWRYRQIRAVIYALPLPLAAIVFQSTGGGSEAFQNFATFGSILGYGPVALMAKSLLDQRYASTIEGAYLDSFIEGLWDQFAERLEDNPLLSTTGELGEGKTLLQKLEIAEQAQETVWEIHRCAGALLPGARK